MLAAVAVLATIVITIKGCDYLEAKAKLKDQERK